MTSTVKYHTSRHFVDLSSAISPKLYGTITGCQMRWVPLTSVDEYIIAGGSSMNSLGYKAHVCCSGYTASYGRSPRPHRIHSVRGPLSQKRIKNHMNVDAPCAGDPLLLVSDLYDLLDEKPAPCVFTQKKSTKYMSEARHVCIDDSLETILTAVKNSTFVLTDLFEGLIFADSFKVPSCFVSGGSIPFVVKDYLENFDKSDQGVVNNFPDKLSVSCSAKRDVGFLRNKLLKTIPSL